MQNIALHSVHANRSIPAAPRERLQDTLRDGTKRTPHKKQELIRITLPRHLRSVIEQEAAQSGNARLTNLEPWHKTVLEKAYRKVGTEWDRLETAASRAQGKPDFDD
jgi:hypothetical protein